MIAVFLKKISHITFLTILTIVVPGHYYNSFSQPVHEYSYRHPESKGFLVSIDELINIQEKAKSNIEPYNTNVEVFIHYIDSLMGASESWDKMEGEIIIGSGSSSEPVQLSSAGSKLVYGAAIAWALTGNEKYAAHARKMIIDLSETFGYRDKNKEAFHWGAQGILNLARGGTPYLYAADLLEDWQGWTKDDKEKFQIWLRDEMYPKVAWASRVRKNNWGVAGSFSAAAIAFYLFDHPDWILSEQEPVQAGLSPEDAYESHNMYQLGRLSTSMEWKMDAKQSLWGILPNGAIPEEIRRGNDDIAGDHLASSGSGTTYTMSYIEHLTAHAEFLRRRGDTSLYDNQSEDGSGSLLQAYLFVIDNNVKSHCFTGDRRNALYIAFSYYKNPAILESLIKCGESDISGQRLALYGRLTHPVELR